MEADDARDMVLLSSLLAEYEVYQQHRKKRRPRGVARYLGQLRACFAALGAEATTADLTPARLDAYLADEGERWAANTVLLALSALRSFCAWLVRTGRLATDPTRQLDAPRKHRPAPKPLTRAELRVLFRVIAAPERETAWARAQWARNRRAIYLMLYAGLRLAEVAALRWRDVELDAGTLVVRDGKGGKDRSVPIHPALAAELRKHGPLDPDLAVAGRTDHRPYSDPQSLAHLFERTIPHQAERMGLTLRLSAHRLRHTFATEMLRGGVDLRSIQVLLGHSDLNTTQMYLLVDAGQLRSAVNALPAAW